MHCNCDKFLIIHSLILFISLEIADAQFERDANIKEKKYTHLKNEVIPFYMEKLNAIAKENNGYMALGRVNLVDMFNTNVTNFMDFFFVVLVDLG